MLDTASARLTVEATNRSHSCALGAKFQHDPRDSELMYLSTLYSIPYLPSPAADQKRSRNFNLSHPADIVAPHKNDSTYLCLVQCPPSTALPTRDSSENISRQDQRLRSAPWPTAASSVNESLRRCRPTCQERLLHHNIHQETTRTNATCARRGKSVMITIAASFHWESGQSHYLKPLRDLIYLPLPPKKKGPASSAPSFS